MQVNLTADTLPAWRKRELERLDGLPAALRNAALKLRLQAQATILGGMDLVWIISVMVCWYRVCWRTSASGLLHINGSVPNVEHKLGIFFRAILNASMWVRIDRAEPGPCNWNPKAPK